MQVKLSQLNRIYNLLFLICLVSCSKLVQVPEPVTSITSSETFSTNASANSAIVGIYSDLILGYNQNFDYGNGATTLFAGLSADELNYFDNTDLYTMQFQNNTLKFDNPRVGNFFWSPPYFDIYLANAAIEGLQTSTGVSAAMKKQLSGEAKFIRAFCNFYLINLFGDIPLVTTTAWKSTGTLPRTPVATVYQQIISDLKDAENQLTSDYSISNGERYRVNKWAAAALLSRTYLYTRRWDSAEAQASNVINNTSLYRLDSLNNAFLINSNESIWQLQINSNLYPYATQEGENIIPFDSISNPTYYLTNVLLNDFETGDQRKLAWVDSVNYLGTAYYYPHKYKVRVGSSGNVTENYMVLRLAEQYLVRAEARAQSGSNLNGAIADLNVIRERAGLPDLSSSLTQQQVLLAVMRERRIELFSEWGHRWFDLKRTGEADSTLLPIKPLWQSFQKLYPIPLSELKADPNLTQNTGY